jgi:hypothetical protein
MANTFKRHTSRSIGTSATAVGSYTVGSGTQTTIIGLTVANITASTINVDVAHVDSLTNSTHIVKDAPIPSGGSLVVVGGDQKVVMETGDQIKVTSDTASSADVIMSILEIT